MTALELNQAYQLAFDRIKDDESLVLKVLNYIKRIAPKRETAEKDAVLASIDRGLKELNMVREGKLKPRSAYELLKELRND